MLLFLSALVISGFASDDFFVCLVDVTCLFNFLFLVLAYFISVLFIRCVPVVTVYLIFNFHQLKILLINDDINLGSILG